MAGWTHSEPVELDDVGNENPEDPDVGTAGAASTELDIVNSEPGDDIFPFVIRLRFYSLWLYNRGYG